MDFGCCFFEGSLMSIEELHDNLDKIPCNFLFELAGAQKGLYEADLDSFSPITIIKK